MVHIQLVGDVELTHAKVIADAINVVGGNGGVYFLRDARRAGTITREAREYLVRNLKPGVLLGVVTYGSSFQSSIMASIIAYSLRALGRGLDVPVFVANEAAARAWIEKHRAAAKARQTDETSPR